MTSRIGLRAVLCAVAALALTGVGVGEVAAQQTGTIQGTVTDLTTARPLPSAQVTIQGTQLGTLTNQQGRFQLVNVPAGTHTLRVELVGYGAATRQVTVTAGETTTSNVSLEQTAIALQELVVTGVAEATTRAKLPFTVDQLRTEDLPVPVVSAGSAIQGKVAGATVISGSGRPGAAPTILLRGPTSINASGRNQEPLYIVDGVILSSSMVDIDALDIESIEVVKGAAAASLYGSRAGSGVVQITTRRGRGIQDDQVRYTVRSEVGQSELPGRFNLTRTHHYQMDGQNFVDVNGNRSSWLELPAQPALAGQFRVGTAAASNWNTVQREAWPGQTYDHVGEFFRNGRFMQNYVSAEGRSGATNYHISFSNMDESGVMPGQDGFQRNNFRLNLDQSVRPTIQLSGSAFYSRSTQNDMPENQGNPMFALTRMPAGVNLRGCVDNMAADCTGPADRLNRLIIEPDPQQENDNPLYMLLNRNYDIERGRFLGSANMRWSPLAFMSVDANVSYDRLDYAEQDYRPKGYRDIRNTAGLRDGNLIRYNELNEALNASATATFRHSFGDVNTRTQLRYLWEQQDREWTNTSGFRFAVGDVPTFGNIDQETITASSGNQPVRSDGFFAITNFDIRDRYILDALVRNDGSSLFGPDQRRHWYYRLAGAWRLSEEPFFQFPAVNEFKLRYAIGTAGGRPSWAAQYETYSVAGGSVTPVTLGNRELGPEQSREQEFGIDAAFLDRFVFTANYATTETTDQILLVPQAAYTGFANRWQNAGTLESNTVELSLDARLLERQDFSWSARLLYDRTRQEITELNVPAYTYGVAGQNLGTVFYARPGEALGTFYGTQVATSCEHLPASADCSQFAVNNDGLLVWTGGANPNAGWGTGANGANLWGTQAPASAAIRGVQPMWGEPIVGECTDRSTGERTTYCPLGQSMPDYSIGLSSTVNWRGFAVYGLLESVQGFTVYNQPLQWATFQNYSGIVDQSGVPEAQQKPLGYYARLYGVSGLAPSSEFVDDASFVKLRELSVRYRFGADQLGAIPVARAFDGATLSLSGRNLLTWSDYDGYDPEVGRGGGTTGSAALARVDGFNYPNFRTFTVGLELNF